MKLAGFSVRGDFVVGRGALLAALSLLALAGCASGGLKNQPSRAANPALSFFVIGDAPYGPEDEAMLVSALPLIKAVRPDFVVHVGDFKAGRAPCDGSQDDAFAALIADLAPIPLFYTPGDNEWTDCDRNNDPATGAPYSELGRLDVVRARFFSAPPPGADRFAWRNQDGYPENATWKDRNVRFATLHVVGTADGWGYVDGDPLDLATAAARTRGAAATAWLREAASTAKAESAEALIVAMQADPTETRNFKGTPCAEAVSDAYRCDAFLSLRQAFRDAAAAYGGPILVIHGDTEPFTLDQDFLDGGATNLWRLNAAGDAGVDASGKPYGVRDVTEVVITPGADAPFAAKGLLTGAVPAGLAR